MGGSDFYDLIEIKFTIQNLVRSHKFYALGDGDVRSTLREISFSVYLQTNYAIYKFVNGNRNSNAKFKICCSQMGWMDMAKTMMV